MTNQICIFDGENELKIKTPVRLIELFAGVGAQAKALENIGANFENYRVCEIDKNAIKSYNAIHNTAFEPTDITKIGAADLGIVETNKYTYILTYSFPCQDLSKAGKCKGMKDGKQSSLLWEVKRILSECIELPQVLLMENVPDVIGKRNIKDFAEWFGFLTELGYKNWYQLCNARNYGLPQNRERCFMVSALGNYYYQFPKGFPLCKKASDYYDDSRILLDNEITEKSLIIDKTQEYAKIRQATKKGYIELKNNGCVVLSFPNSTSRRGRVIKYGDIAPTITCATQEIYKFIDGEFYKLSPLEAWRLMGFDDQDVECCKQRGVTDNQLYNQAGNSIAVNVLEAIFQKMF